MDLARSSLKLFIANLANAAIGFLGITYFAQKLGATPMGIFFLFEALLGMLAIPADFGLRGAVEKRISEGESPGVLLSSAIALKFVPITAIVLAILLLRSYINNYLGADVAVFLAVAIVLQEAAQLSIFVLKGELRVGETAVLQVARQAIWVGLGAILVSRGFGAKGLIYGLLTGLGVMLLWGWYKSSTSPERPSREHARSLFDYGKYNMVSSIGGYFYSWMDVALIGLFLTQAHVGAYEVAWRVTTIVLLLSNAIAESVLPQVSRWDTEGASSKIESAIRETITPSLLLVIPSFFGAVVFSREILGIVFGEEFTIAWLVLIILMGEKILQSIHKILGRSLQGVDRPDLAAYATVAAVLANLLLNVVLIVRFGIVGAAIATTISFALNTFLHGYFLSRFVRIDFPMGEIGWLVVASIVMTAGLGLLSMFVELSNLYRLVFVILLGAAMYGGTVLLYRPLREKVTNWTLSLFFGSLNDFR